MADPEDLAVSLILHDEAVPQPEPIPEGRLHRPWWRGPRRTALGVGGALLIVAVVALGAAGGGGLTTIRAAILGAVEGVTEFLPVSSTGHLVVVERLFGLGGTARALEALDSYAVVIQGGAILAVAWIFRRRLWAAARALPVPGLGRKDPAAGDRRVATAVIVAAAPAGVIGLVAGDAVKEHLFSVVPIALAWAAGGLALVGLAGRLRHRDRAGIRNGCALDDVTARQALAIGLAQAVALWPGVSRSLVTIVAGCLVGLSLAAAVELSFLVGFVVLLGASGFELARHGHEIVALYGWANPLLGVVVAFVCAVAAIRWLLRALTEESLAGFGWYRLAAAACAVGLLVAGRI